MPKIVVIDSAGRAAAHSVDQDSVLMETLRDLGLVDAVCGGGASCGTCAVRIDGPWRECLPPPDAAEQTLLEGLDYNQAGCRLSCQLILSEELDGMSLRVLEAS